MLWVKAFHLIFVISWFAALFYLPRLFVYHAMTSDEISNTRFKVMERRLYYGIMTPAAILTLISGVWLLIYNPLFLQQTWLQLKLVLVAILFGFHFYCGHLYRTFKADCNQHGHVFYRWLNEIPTVILIAIIILAIVQPF